MPQEKTIFICPVCKEEFEGQWEAEEHLSEHEVDEVVVYECEGCGEQFDTLIEAEKHESSCPFIDPGCENCNNFDSGMRRHWPCKRLSLDKDLSPCELYQRAKVV